MRKNMGLHRGKRNDNDEWVKGFYVHLHDHKGNESHRIYPGYAETDCGDYYPDWFDVDPETVGLCSGLPDKHGNLIYEDDYVRIDEDVKKTFPMVEDGPVRFSRGGFFASSYGDILRSFDVIADIRGVFRGEVIGNIHDNPELLEVK